jgi:hypothetical protein
MLSSHQRGLTPRTASNWRFLMYLINIPIERYLWKLVYPNWLSNSYVKGNQSAEENIFQIRRHRRKWSWIRWLNCKQQKGILDKLVEMTKITNRKTLDQMVLQKPMVILTSLGKSLYEFYSEATISDTTVTKKGENTPFRTLLYLQIFPSTSSARYSW